MSRPMIGVTVSEIRHKQDAQQVRHGEPTQTELTLGLSYMHAVELAGGLPVALTPLEHTSIEPLLDHLSGLLLTGGPDLDPSCYGAEPHRELGPTDHAVDEFELGVCGHAYRRRIPILGICRGAQVLNVARQGTLHQHIPDLNGGAVQHRQSETGVQTTHEVRVASDSSLAQTTGGGPVKVNSFHHQAIDRLGLYLRPVAWAQDGLVEAVEATDGHFAIGVQWHAETLVGDAEQLALFERLVEASRSTSPGGKQQMGSDEDAREDSDAHAV